MRFPRPTDYDERRRPHVRGSYRPTIKRTLAPIRGALREMQDRDVPSGAVSRLPAGPPPGTWAQWLCVDCPGGPDVTDNKPCDHCGGTNVVLGVACAAGCLDSARVDLLGERCSVHGLVYEPDYDCEVPR